MRMYRKGNEKLDENEQRNHYTILTEEMLQRIILQIDLC